MVNMTASIMMQSLRL